MPARNSPISDGFIFRRTHAGMGMSIAQPDTFRSTKVPPRASTRSISCHARAVAGCRAKPSAMDRRRLVGNTFFLPTAQKKPRKTLARHGGR